MEREDERRNFALKKKIKTDLDKPLKTNKQKRAPKLLDTETLKTKTERSFPDGGFAPSQGAILLESNLPKTGPHQGV